ncbi:MAG: glycosyltransferase family 39 protein [Chlamydiales bacterium]
MYQKNFIYLLLILSVKSFAMLILASYGPIALGPDEAQYWTWSQSLDWGYYSKPPGIAWEIAFGTFLFGNTELGVRFGAIVLGFFLPLSVFELARSCRLHADAALMSALMLAFSPLGFLASLFATTDHGYVLFWTLSCVCLIKGIERQAPPSYLILGLLIGLGALFKWPIYVFWLIVIVAILANPVLKSRSLIYGFLLSLLGCLPSLVWNIQHDWSTFRHVIATILGSKGSDYAGPGGNFFDFLGAQAALVSPLLFILMLIAFIRATKSWKGLRPSLKACCLITIIPLTLYLGAALFKKMQGNWAVFVYPTAFVITGWYLIEKMRWGKIWGYAGVILSIFLFGVLVFTPISYRYNPLRHCLGWRELNEILVKAGYNPSDDFLFSDHYQMTSLLSFYGPEKKQAYFFNISGRRKNQFSYWETADLKEKGKEGYFVIVAPSWTEDRQEKILKNLQPYFEEVRLISEAPLWVIHQKPQKIALVFKGIAFKGNQPKDPEIY